LWMCSFQQLSRFGGEIAPLRDSLLDRYMC
jgi:hypothetical protein